MGWAVANCSPSLTKRDRALVTWASVIPDADGLGIVAEWVTRGSSHPLEWWSRYHHVLGHNVGFAILVTVSAAIFSKQPLKTAALACVSFHLHLLGDLIGARGPDGDQWPIPYLLPFSDKLSLTWHGQWALNAWPNVVITATLIVLAFIVARERGFSPLEMLSARGQLSICAHIANPIPKNSAFRFKRRKIRMTPVMATCFEAGSSWRTAALARQEAEKSDSPSKPLPVNS